MARWLVVVCACLFAGAAAEAALVSNIPASYGVTPSGDASYTIPIEVPPGRRGMAPNLALAYSSSSGPGLAGLGWNVAGLSAITRCNLTYAQDGNAKGIEFVAGDGYCLDGARLWKVSGTYGANGSVYRTEVDTFSRVTAYTSGGSGGTPSGGPKWFEVYGRDGLILKYGETADSRIDAFPGTSSSPVRVWALSQIRDRSGNTIDFEYLKDGDSSGYRPSAIRYTGFSTGPGPHSVVFEYQARSAGDTHRWYIGGAQVDLEHQLAKIRTEYNGSTIREYALTYETSAATGATRLQKVGLRADGLLVSETQFTWTTGAIGWSSSYSSTNVPAGTATYAFLVDQNGNGRSDLLFPNNGLWYLVHFNDQGLPTSNGVSTGVAEGFPESATTLDLDGDGLRDFFVAGSGGPNQMLRSTGDAGSGFADEGCIAGCSWGSAPADVDGDGYEDVVFPNSTGIGVYRNTGTYSGGTRFASAVTAYQVAGDTYPTNAFLATTQSLAGTPVPVDFDGDGRSDLITLVTRTQDPGCGGEPGCDPTPYVTTSWRAIRSVSVPGSPAFTGYSTLGDTSVITNLRALDINGDGLTDIAFVNGGKWWTQLSTGTGFTAPVNSGVAPVNPDKARAVDYDGDGWTDLVYPPTSGQWRALRSNGVTFEAGPAVGLANGGNMDAVRIADVDGDGDPEFLVPFGNPSKWRIYFRNGIPGDRMASATDGYGNTFEPTYGFLTDGSVYTKGTGGTSPGFQDYQGPRMVARSYDASNGVGGEFTMSYSYEAARVNRQGRGFLGFGRVTEIDSRNSVRAVTDYLQQFPYTALPQQVTVRQPDNKIITESDSTYTPAGSAPYKVLLQNQTTIQNEVGGPSNGLLASTVSVANTFDTLGVLTQQVRTVTAGDGANYTTTVDNTPQNDTTNWCLGLVSSSSTTVQLPTVPATLSRSYSNDTITCRVNSETQAASNVLGYAVPAVTTSYEYGDAWGNVTKTTVTSGGQSRWVSVNYGTDGYFPRVANNPAGLQVVRTFDYRFGLTDSEQDPNGLTVASQYDALGFLESQYFPDGTEVTLVRQPYSDSSMAAEAYRVQMEERLNGVPASRAEAIFDQRDRTLRQIVYLRGGVASYQDTVYDALGRTASVTAPYGLGNPIYSTSYGYDLIGRVIGITEPASETTTASHTFVYDIDTTLGFKTTYTDPKSKTTIRWTDALGRLRKVRDADNFSTIYAYDVLGNLQQVTDPLNRVVTLSHDDRGLRRQMNDPSSGLWQYDYTSLGELYTQTDAKNQTYTFGYDNIGRLTLRTGPLGESTTWVYDSAIGAGLGRLDQVYTADGFIRDFDYDTLGRVADVHQTQDGIAYDTSFAYDTYGRLASVTYPDSPPDGAPAPASISVPGGPHVSGYTVSWAAVTGTAISYELQEATDADFTDAVIAYSGTSTSKAIGTKPAGSYYYRVRACDGGLCGNYTASSTPAVVSPPASTPTAINVPVGYDPDGSYTISWTVSPGVYSELYESTSATFTTQTLVYGGTAASKPISGKGNGTYYYRVRACVNSVPEGCSSYRTGSGGVQVTLAPAAPASISVPSAFDTDGAYTVSWGAVSGATYELYESTNASFSPESLVHSGTTASKAFSGKTDGSYYYRVRACNTVNPAACSAYRTGTNPVQVTLPPPPPTSIFVPTGSTNTTGSYTVSWTAQTGVTYKLWEANNSSFSGQTLIYTGTTNSKAITGQINGTYYYRVKACNSVNTASCSTYRASTTGLVVLRTPGVPSSISVNPTYTIPKEFTVSWGSATGTVTRYELQQQYYSGAWSQKYSGLALSKFLTVTQNGEYRHRVRACNSASCSNWRTGALVAVGNIQLLAPPGEESEPTAPSEADLQTQVEHRRQVARMAALMRKQALHRQAWPEQAGSVVGGSGTGYRYRVSYQYDAYGHVQSVREPDNGNRVVWTAEAMDAFGHVQQATLGNGVSVNAMMDAATGRITNIQAGLGNAIQNLSYQWDLAGNLEHRQDLRQGLTETFTYDNLHRVNTASVQGGPTMGIDYDAVGNITHKQVTGSSDPAANYNLNYQYPANGARLTSISGDLAATMVHDANGSITGGLYTVTWTPFNMPASISRPGQGTSTFKYGPERQRYRHDYTENGSTITRHIVGHLFEAVHKTTVTEYHHHVMAYGEVVATHIRRSNGLHGTVWPLKDHLGGVDVVLDEATQEVGRTSFDSFGRRRSASSWDGPPDLGSIVGGVREFTNRGHTGHEMLDSVDLVHMNGRVYDPMLGRFLSVDPIVAAPGSTQGWNRYSYVYNNPLAFVDPSGLSPADRILHWRILGGPDCGYGPGGECRELWESFVRSQPSWGSEPRNPDGTPRGGTATPTQGGGEPPAPPVPPEVTGPGPDHVVSLYEGPGLFSAMFDVDPLPAPRALVAGGTLALSVVPGGGEALDIAVLSDLNSTGFERALAVLSLGINAATGGLAPNLGVLTRVGRRGGPDDVVRALEGGEPNRIYSARELVRRAEEPGPLHNFPESFNERIFRGERHIISDNYVLYTQRGSVNGVSGTFEIGVQPSASGRTEVILHRFFRPDRP